MKINALKLLLLSLTMLQLSARAQFINADSLVDVLNTQELSEKEKLKVLNNICEGYFRTDLEKMLPYTEQGLKFAQKVKNYTYIAKFYNYYGKYYAMKGEFPDKSMPYYEKAIEAAKEGKDFDQEINVYNAIGVGYANMANHTEALKYYLRCLAIAESANFPGHTICNTLLNVASIYMNFNNREKAFEYSNKAKQIAENINDTVLIKNKIDIDQKMRVYSQLGSLYLCYNELDSAQYYLLLSDSLCDILNNKSSKLYLLESIVLLYGSLKDYEKAEYYVKEMLKRALDFGEQRAIIAAYIKLSDLYRWKGQFKEMEHYARMAYEMDSTNIELTFLEIYNMTFANIYLDNKDSAISYLMQYRDIAMQRSGKELHDALTEQEVKYETEKKELRIAALMKEKQMYIWLGLAGGALLIALLILFFYHRRMSRQKIRHLEQEKQLVAAEAVIDGESTERARLARDLHDGLGGMLSAVKINLNDIENLQNARDMLDNSIEELRRVAHHLMPASLLRFGMKASLEDYCNSFPNVHFHYFGEDRRIPEKLEILVYRCVYELVNNAIKHSQASNINVQLVLHEDRVSLTVQDDGRGFDPATTGEGMGLENLRTRLAAFKGTMDITSAPGEGAETNIELLL